MKIMAWNVRGLGSARKRILIKETIKKARIDIVMIQETKLKVINQKWVRSIWSSWNKNWAYLPSFGASGGQLIIWKDEIFEHLDILPRAYTLSIKFRNKDNGVIWCLTSVYGPVQPHERETFWTQLVDIQALWNIPCCLGGDFNAIWFSQEIRGGSRTTRSMRGSNDFINNCALIDCPPC